MTLAERLAALSPAERERFEARLGTMRAQPARDALVRRAQEEAPLSFVQELFADLERGASAGSAYNVPTALRVRGPLDLTRLQRALDALVARREILRTTFAERDGVRIQRVAPASAVPVRLADCTSVPAEAREADARTRLCEAASLPFDLSTDLLVRVVVLRYAPQDHALLVVCHHVASDVQSRALLFRELAALYDGAALPVPALQYADFAAWQRERYDDAERARVLAGRRARLLGAPESIGLPTDRPRTLVPQFAGARRSRAVPRAVGQAFLATARALEATPFVAFYAAFATLVHRLTGEEDIAIGSVFAGRPRLELGEVLGCFAHVLPLRTTVEDDPAFATFVVRAGRAFFDAAEDAEIPLDATPWPGMPKLAVIFTLVDDTQAAEPRFGDCTLEPIAFDRGAAKVEFSLSVRLAPERIVLEAEYRTDLFDAASVDRLLERYCLLLEAAAADATRRLSALRIVGPAERAALLALGTPAARSYSCDATLPELLEAVAALRPDAVAVRGPEATFTYADLMRRAEGISADLRMLDVGRGTLVGVCLERSAQMVAVLLGILRTGAAYVPLDPAFPVARLGMMTADGDIAVIVSESSLAPLVQDILDHAAREGAPQRAILYSCEEQTGARISPNTVRPLAETRSPASATDLAYVLFTSGSTGRPKGVAVTHRSLINFLEAMLREPGLRADDTVLAVTTLSFDIAGLEVWLPLLAGACTAIASRAQTLDGTALAALLQSSRATFLQATPATWRLLLEAGWSGDRTLRMLCGGEALDAGLASALLARGAALWNVYGPTETTIWSTISRVREGDPISLGEPLANTRLYVMEPSGELAPYGVVGELAIGGDGVAVGYLGQPAMTAERFVPDPFTEEPGARMYRTGDLVRRHSDGRLEFLGRRDGQVKIRGFRIELGDIEAALVAHPDLLQAVAVVRTDTQKEPQVVAYLRERRPVADRALHTMLRERLPGYMIPAAFVRLRAFPLTANGKIDRRALPPPGPEETRERRAPRNEHERLVRDAFASVLTREPATLDMEDDFFALGGHSLLAMRLVAVLEGRFRVRLSLASVFASSSIAALAEVLAPHIPHDASTSRALPVRPDRTRAPLTFAQEALWLFEQRSPGTAAYVIPVLRCIEGPLDDDAFSAALDAVFARHEPLRARIMTSDGEPYQCFSAATSSVLQIHDLRGIADSSAREDAAQRLLETTIRTPFDLEAGPLVRATLVRTEEHRRFFLLAAHHIVFDGGSVPVLFEDLRRAYDAVCAGTPLPGLPKESYGDLAVREAANVDRAALRTYWERRLAGAPLRVELPSDRPYERMGHEGARLVRIFPPALAEALERTAREHGVTLFMLLLAAYAVLLARYARTEDLVIGSAVGGRGESGEDLVGYLTATVPLRIDLAGDPTFVDLLSRVRTTCIEAYDHRASTGGGAFSTMFVLQESVHDFHLGDAEVRAETPVRDAIAFDLVLSASVDDTGLRASLGYRSALFDASTIEGMLASWETLLGGIVADANAAVAALPLVGPAERCVLLEAAASASVSAWDDTLVHRRIAARAEQTPQAIALRCEDGRTYRYDELLAWSRSLAHELRARDVGRGALVGLCLERSPELIAATLAVLEVGAAFVPLDPQLPVERLRMMIADAEPAVILTQPAFLAEARRWKLPLLAAAPTPPLAVPATSPVTEVASEDLAYVIYTSGSSGVPKGVRVSHEALANYVDWMCRTFPLGPGAQILYRTPLGFDPAVSYTVAPLVSGAVLRLGAPGLEGDTQAIVSILAREPITVIEGGPSLVRMLLEEPEFARASALRYILCGGEPLPSATVRRLSALLPQVELINLYGPTEATISATFHRCRADEPSAAVPIGRAVDNVRLYVVDTRGELVPRGMAGELLIGGKAVAQGYLRRPELTAERFIPDSFLPLGQGRVYRSGDLVRMRTDGNLEYLGRMDDQVKLRGFRIELGEIEAVLSGIPGVLNTAVVVRPHTSGEPELVAYYMAAPDGPAAAVVREGLRAQLPRYMVPAVIVRREDFVLTPNGKIDRRALPAATAADRGLSRPHVAPRTASERILAGAFAEVLEREEVGVDDDFFELGGHSLHAMRVIARVRKMLRISVSLREFFENATVTGLMTLVERDEPQPGYVAALARALEAVASMNPQERAQRREQRSSHLQTSRV